MSITEEKPVTKRQGHGKSSASTISGDHVFASQFDQRFSYCLYVPEDYDEDGTETHELLVIIHGTDGRRHNTAITSQILRERTAALYWHRCFQPASS